MVRYRPLVVGDIAAVLDLSVRAWTPVFESLEAVLGSELFLQLHPDWRAGQRQGVEDACLSEDVTVWVAESDGSVIGFVGFATHEDRGLGEIHLVAVDPDRQSEGIGAALTKLALGELRKMGMSMAVAETGGDPGHAAARRMYESTGFTVLPIARFFKVL